MMGASKQRTDQAAAVIQNWIDQGLMDPVDPMLFLFHLWAVTQFYADHATQVAFFRHVVESDEKDRRLPHRAGDRISLEGRGRSLKTERRPTSRLFSQNREIGLLDAMAPRF